MFSTDHQLYMALKENAVEGVTGLLQTSETISCRIYGRDTDCLGMSGEYLASPFMDRSLGR